MNLVTVQEGIFLYDINGANGMMFKTNHQYCYTGKATLNTPCCGIINAYIIPITTKVDEVVSTATYNVPARVCVETTVIIEKHWQDFYRVYSEDFLQQRNHHYYGEINNNCINCNGLKFHGDYSNNGETPGYKDPLLVPGKDEEGSQDA